MSYYWLVGLAGVFVVAVVLMEFTLRKLEKRLGQLENLSAHHNAEMVLLTQSHEAFEAQLQDAKTELEQLKQESKLHELYEGPEAARYAQAIKLAQRGAGIDELVGSCGLSQPEAKLILTMHGGRTKDS